MQDRIRQIDEISCNARPDHTFGSKPEELRMSTTSPLNSPTADIGADIDLRRSGPIGCMTIYRPATLRFADVERMAVAPANLFSNEDMRLYLPLSVGLAFKEPHCAARNCRCLLI